MWTKSSSFRQTDVYKERWGRLAVVHKETEQPGVCPCLRGILCKMYRSRVHVWKGPRYPFPFFFL